MNQKIFEHELIRRADKKDYMSEGERRDIIKKSVNRVSQETKLCIAMEEMAECSVAISKVKRFFFDEHLNKSDPKLDSAALNLIEEMADVYLCLSMVQEALGVDPKYLYAAIDTKLAREAKRCE